MRKVMIGAVILLMLGGVVVLALRNLSGFVERNKDFFVTRAEKALGRKVTVGEIGVTLWGGIGVRLTDFAIGDDPAFSAEDFLRATDLQVNVQFIPLLWKELRIKRFILHRPVITVIRNKAGQLNVATLARTDPGETEAEQSATETGSPAAGTAGATALPLFVSLVDVANGEVRYVDLQKNADLRVSQVDFRVADLSFEQPLALSLKAAVLAERQNLEVQGQVGPLGSALDLQNLAVEGEIRVDTLDLDTLQRALPQLTAHLPQGLGLSGPLQATVMVSGTVKELTFPRIELVAAIFGSQEQNVRVSGRAGPLSQNLADLSFVGDVDLQPVTLVQLKRFAPLGAVVPEELRADGPLSLKTHAEGMLKNFALSGVVEATASAVSYGAHVKKPPGRPLILTVDARLSPKRVALQQATVQLHTLELTGNGEVALDGTPSVDLTIDSNRMDLAGWSDITPFLQGYDASGDIEMHGRVQGKVGRETLPQINGTVRLDRVSVTVPQLPKPVKDLTSEILFTGQKAELKETTLRVGDSSLNVDAQVTSFAPLALTYHVSAPELWLADIQAGDPAEQRSDVLRELKNEGRARVENGSLTYTGRVSSARGTLARVDYADLRATISLARQVLIMEDVSLQTLGGTVVGRVQYAFASTPPQFTVTSRVRDLNLTDYFRSALTTMPQRVQGQANLDLTLTGSGQGWPEIKTTLAGQGRAEIVRGAVLDVNVAEGVLSGVTGIPGLSLLVSPRVRAKYPEIFATQDTKFDELQGAFRVSEGKIHLEDLRMSAADYMTRGTGWLDFDQRLDLRAQLILSQKLSTDIADDVKAAKYIVNEQGRVEIPFALAGTLPSVTPRPDLAYVGRLLQRAALRRGAEELEEKVFKKILPRSKAAPGVDDEGAASAPPPESEPPKRSLEEELLRKGLDKLFGR